MSGDVQPRKRKDKKKKRDDESSHGVHLTKMGTDDVHLHVHQEHGTGGHWCAKIIFFSLMTILLGLVCLIILENRGISDVDTPLSESRFSNYFDGWVDEHRSDHDDHHGDSHGSVEDDHDDDDDEHGEPFEEEADVSEGDEADDEEEDENVTQEEAEEADDNDEDEDEDDNEDDENVTAENDGDDDNATAEEDEEDDNATAEDENVTAEDENADEEDDNATAEEATTENVDEDEDDEDEEDNNTNEDNVDDNVTQETSNPVSMGNDDEDDDPFDEDEDDGNFDSVENIVDNDASELELLKEKARQQAAAEAKNNPASAENADDDEAEQVSSWASSQIKPKPGGPQSYGDDDDDIDLFEQELRRANEEMMREHYTAALQLFNKLIQKYPTIPEVYLGKARTLDRYAEYVKSNRILEEALDLYKKYLGFKTITNQPDYRAVAERCLDRIRFLGQLHHALPIHQMLIQHFPNESTIRNEMAVTYLMLNRLSDAKKVLRETLQMFPDDGFALVHYGFVLKQHDLDYYNASIYLRKGIDSNAKGTQDGRFYFQLGESYQRMGEQKKALEIFKRGADLKLFPSVYQRSLYNEPNLRAQPFWSLKETTYEKFFRKLEQNWLAIKAEGMNAINKAGYFQNEAENLKNKGDWKQFELYARGQQRKANCLKAPVTCSLIEQFPAARECSRGQVKFSVMLPGTHVWPHCGPTNCRLRAHLGLVVPQGTRIRVGEENRSWKEGSFLIFDDSFEHEVWHDGHSLRLVLIVDIWHPDLNTAQRRSLSPI